MAQESKAVLTLQLGTAPQARFGDGRRVPLAPVDAALLAWLALEGPTPRQRLVLLLWPDSNAKDGGNTLRQRVFKLRRSLGEVVVGTATLALADGIGHDLHEADDVLGGTGLEFGHELREWLLVQRGRRRQRVRQSLAELADMAERSRDWPDALAHARELLALEPLSEDAHRRVMRIHYLAGDRTGALLAFDACERVLKHEIGATPSHETIALLRAIEQSEVPSAGSGLVAYVPASVLRPPRLVGREPHWQSLARASLEGSVAIVTGEGGMGKSRLTGDFARAHGFAIVTGGRPGDERVAYASFSRLLRALPRTFWQHMAEPTRRELARLLPELGDAPPRADGEDGRLRLYNAAASLFRPDTSGGGIVFDDLHVADEASINLLQYVVSAGTGRWILAARGSELGPAARRWFEELRNLAPPCELSLEPLTLGQIAELVDSLGIAGLAGERAAPALLERSGGNPQVLLEIVKAGVALGDASCLPAVAGLHRIVAGRISRLSVQAVQLARCAAVASPDFSAELAAHVMGLRTLELADPWAELEAAQVLAGGAFVHDLIHEAALASVPEPVARQLHAEIARFLAERGGEPVRLARHWVQARCWSEAGDAFIAAADRARDTAMVGDHIALLAEAADCFSRCGRDSEHFDALLRRAAVMTDNLAGNEARQAIEAAAALVRTPSQRLDLLMVQAEHANLSGDLETAIGLAAEGARAARRQRREALELRFVSTGASALADLRRAAEGVALLEPLEAMVRRQTSVDVGWNHWHTLALCLDYAGRLRNAGTAWDESRAIAQAAGRHDLAWQSVANAAATLSKMGDVQRAVDLYEQADGLARDAQAPLPRLLSMRSTRAHRLRDLGRYDEALPMLEQALAEFGVRRLSMESALAEHRLAQLFQQLGQPARAVSHLSADRPDVPPWVTTMRAVHRADLACDLGRDAGAAMREALGRVPDPDDIYHRIATLFAARIVPADEGEVLATSLAAWAVVRERLGLALAAHVRAAACALAQGAAARALPQVEAALRLASDRHPDSFYLPEMWLVASRVESALGREDRAQAHRQAGRRWIVETARVPEPFGDSFRHRNPVNRALLV